MEDKLFGKPLIERTDFIKKLKNEDPENEIYIFSGEGNSKERKIKVYMVPIDVPIYRLKNIRTKSPQKTHIAKNDLNHDFFSRDPEDRSALRAQHELLLGIANSDQFKGANHVKTFQGNGYDKAHPMIMTHHGVLVNGNTRMSALRFLYNQDKVAYGMFERVPIAILPDSFTEKDFRELELHLQVNPDIKKDYSWISEAIDCKERIEEGVDIKELVNAYDRKSNDARNPNNLINQLKVADFYLEYIGLKNNYDSLETLQFAFWAWSDWRNKNINQIKRVKFIDKICCDLIKNKDSLAEEGIRGDLFKLIKSWDKKYTSDPALWDQTTAQLSYDVSNSNSSASESSNSKNQLKNEDETNNIVGQKEIVSTNKETIEIKNGENNADTLSEENSHNIADVISETIPENISATSNDNNSKFSFIDIYEEENKIISNVDTNENDDLGELIEIAGDKKVNIIPTLMNVLSTRDEEKKRTADLSLVYNDAININKSVTDCIIRLEKDDIKYNRLIDAKEELHKAKIQIEKLIELIESKTK